MRSLGYRARDFLVMIGENGAVAACNLVIISQNIPNGLLKRIRSGKEALDPIIDQTWQTRITRTKFRGFATTYSPNEENFHAH
jgi:hypothetical protein